MLVATDLQTMKSPHGVEGLQGKRLLESLGPCSLARVEPHLHALVRPQALALLIFRLVSLRCSAAGGDASREGNALLPHTWEASCFVSARSP